MMKWAKYAVMVLMIGLIVAGCENNQNPVESEAPSSLALWALPDNAVFESATFYIYVATTSAQTVDVHRVTGAWDEYTVTWNNFGGAYDTAIEGSFQRDMYGWCEVDLSATVMGWLNGDYPDYGILLDEEVMAYPRSRYHSREATMFQPYLMVTYSMNGDIVTENILAEADALISQVEPNDNFGSLTDLYTGLGMEESAEKQSLLWFDIEGTHEQEGCTSTIGYWKNHAGMKRQPDMVSPLLPVWLGNEGGDKSLMIDTAEMAVDILKMKTYGDDSNGVTKLYAQLLGAKLNLAAGADDYDIADIITAADDFLAMYDWNDWSGFDNEMQSEILYMKDMLDDYNNGVIGPGHCD